MQSPYLSDSTHSFLDMGGTVSYRYAILLIVVISVLTTPVFGQSSIKFTSPTPETYSEFGYSIIDAGDLDGDDIHDFAVGAVKEWGNGRVHTFSGATGGLIRSYLSPNPSSDYWPNYFGNSMCGIGDYNGNGYDDILIGSPGEDIYLGPPWPDWLENAGRAYIYDGNTGAILLIMANLAPHPDFVGYFGCAVDTMGDVNADGIVDFIIGSDNIMEAMGGAFILDGATGSQIYLLGPMSQNETGIYFGATVAGIDDLNNDGICEAAVCAPYEPPMGSSLRSGTVTIFDGATYAFIRQLKSPNEISYSYFGSAFAELSDINGDGINDVVVSATSETPPGAPDHSGRVYVMDPVTGYTIHELLSPTPENGGDFGEALTSIFDFDGDGIRDIAVGAPKETCGGTANDAGRVHIFSAADGNLLCTLGSPVFTTDGLFGSSVATLENVNWEPRLLVGAPNEDPGLTNAGRAYSIHLDFSLATEVENIMATLSWTEWPGTSEYWIYGAQNEPYFKPETSNPFEYRLATVPSDSTSWTTADYIGDPSVNMSYAVVAVDFNGIEMFRSNRTGEFDFDLDYLTGK